MERFGSTKEQIVNAADAEEFINYQHILNNYNMIDLTKLYNAMPEDLKKKVSCYDLDRTVRNYNEKEIKEFDPVLNPDCLPEGFMDEVNKVSSLMMQLGFDELGGLKLR